MYNVYERQQMRHESLNFGKVRGMRLVLLSFFIIFQAGVKSEVGLHGCVIPAKNNAPEGCQGMKRQGIKKAWTNTDPKASN